jgi:hypothetical protein
MIGEYELLIILQENRPTYCTSMKAETVEAFIRFKMCDRSIALKDFEGNTICNIDDEKPHIGVYKDFKPAIGIFLDGWKSAIRCHLSIRNC